MQDSHYSIMELSERLGALGAGPAAVGAAAAASRGNLLVGKLCYTSSLRLVHYVSVELTSEQPL